MRQVLTMQPGVAGMNLDEDAFLLDKNQSAHAQDAIALDLLLRRIKGWEYVGDSQAVAEALVSVSRHRFALADTVKTIVGTAGGDLYVHNDSGAGDRVFDGSTPYYFRAMYGDEALFCADDGETPMRRWSGSMIADVTDVGEFGLESSYISGLSLSSAPTPGSYITIDGLGDQVWWGSFRIIDSTTTYVTIDGLFGGSTRPDLNVRISATGIAYPCVNVYDAGTVRWDDLTLDGFGTKWATGHYKWDPFDIMLRYPSSERPHAQVQRLPQPTDDDTFDFTSISLFGGDSFRRRYAILRACPFKDVATHRDSLFGTGVAAYPNTVYVGPQGWNLNFPPGVVPPWSVATFDEDPNTFLMRRIHVPTPFDGDPNIALLSSPQGVWVIKRKAAHRIYGDYPSFRQQLIGNGYGTLDRRSAHSFAGFRVWGGEEDIWIDRGAREPESLTQQRNGIGGINNDWRARTSEFVEGVDVCTIGETRGHLLVSLTSGGGQDHVLYLCDLRTGAWVSKLTNHKARFFFSSKVPGEPEALLWVGDDQEGRVINSTPAIDGTGDSANADGTRPSFEYVSGSGLGEAAGIEGEVTVGDVAVHANLYDGGAEGSSQVAISVVHSGGLRQDRAETKNLEPIESDDSDEFRRHERRVNRSGRQVQLVIEDGAVGDDPDAKFELAEIVLELFDAGVAT